MGPYLKSS